MFNARKIKVGVLRGGPSSEYEVSLKTGASVLQNMPEKYSAHDVFIDRNGLWHFSGVVREPSEILKNVDVVFNALHGQYGEDGKVQGLLDMFGVPYTGSGALPSALGMNKFLSKQVFLANDLKTPRFYILRKGEYEYADLLDVFSEFFDACVVKPACAGSSVGVSIVKDFPNFKIAVAKAFEHSDTVIIEELIRGREATCGVVEGLKNKIIYSLFPIEIVKPESSDFFDYDAKYKGGTQEICPGDFSYEDKEAIQEMAIKAHQSLGLKHYSRSDFIVTPDDGIYILEVNTLPGLTSESLLPKSLAAAGTSFPEFLDHLVSLALNRK